MADLILKTHPAMSFDKETRQRFVQMVTQIIAAGSSVHPNFQPEMLNKSDLEWCVDAGNDWWVFFDPKDRSLVRIKQRYDVKPALTAIGAWLAYRWRMTVLNKELALPEEADDALN